MPVVEWHGRAHVVETPEAIEAALARIYAAGTVGIDTETRPTFAKGRRNKVALLQVSTPADCYLFRLNITGLNESLKRFLEDASITKIGLSLHDDVAALQRRLPIAPAGLVELQTMVKEYMIADASLQKVYAIVFGRRISKGQRLTNWEAPELTEAQQAYASIDAWACLKLYNHLKAGRFDPLSSPYLTDEEEREERGESGESGERGEFFGRTITER